MSSKYIYRAVEGAQVVASNETLGKIEFLDKTHRIARENPHLLSSKFKDMNLGDLLEVEIGVRPNGRRAVLAIRQVGESLAADDQRPTRSTTMFKGGWIGGTYFPKPVTWLLSAADILSATVPTTVAFTGPSGYGKTLYGEVFAEATCRRFYRVNCSAVRDPEEWFGYREAINGSTAFVPTTFTDLVRGGNAVIILDEFNRIEPWIQNTLLPLLDDAHETEIHGESIVCGPNLIFIVTLNEGAGFTGTFVLDEALANRVDAGIEVTALPQPIETEVLVKRTAVDESKANQIVEVLTYLRGSARKYSGIDFSTRVAIKVANLVAAGLTVREAFEYVIMYRSRKGSDGITDYLNVQLGTLEWEE